MAASTQLLRPVEELVSHRKLTDAHVLTQLSRTISESNIVEIAVLEESHPRHQRAIWRQPARQGNIADASHPRLPIRKH